MFFFLITTAVKRNNLVVADLYIRRSLMRDGQIYESAHTKEGLKSRLK